MRTWTPQNSREQKEELQRKYLRNSAPLCKLSLGFLGRAHSAICRFCILGGFFISRPIENSYLAIHHNHLVSPLCDKDLTFQCYERILLLRVQASKFVSLIP